MNTTATVVAVSLAVVVALGFLFFGPSVFRPFESAPSTEQSNIAMATTSSEGAPQIPNELPKTLAASDDAVGTGEAAKAGDTVTVNYVGVLPDGTVFDASANHGQAFTFTLGAGQVIPGWDQGIVGMKVGGKRRLVIPPDMAYGSRDLGVIPPNSTLIFEVELVKIGQ